MSLLWGGKKRKKEKRYFNVAIESKLTLAFPLFGHKLTGGAGGGFSF